MYRVRAEETMQFSEVFYIELTYMLW
jgi:hypothetical protein